MGRGRGGSGGSAFGEFNRLARGGARMRRQEIARQNREAGERADHAERATYESVTNRPAGELDAGIGEVDGYPALYEQGGVNGDPNRIDVYHGPQGPLGGRHGHIVSNNGGDGADYVREPDGEVRTDSRW